MRSRLTLAALCAAQFLVVLDVTVVNVALPAIGDDLAVPAGRLHWAISAYAIVFGGLLLAAGRIADLRGARRVFLTGLAVFGVTSLACGLAWSGEALAIGRALQGLGAALVSPAALALISEGFEEGRARTRALGVWASTGALAAASGVLLGGVAVELADWRAIFIVNVPVAAAALAIGLLLLPQDRPRERPPIDLAGAVLLTAAIMALVAALSDAAAAGPSPTRTAALAGVAVLLFALVRRRQARVPSPLLPPAILRDPQAMRAGMVGALHGAMMLAAFLLLTLHQQEVLGLSALAAGAGLLAARAGSTLWAAIGARLVEAFGPRAVMGAGMLGMTTGLVTLACGPGRGSYVSDLLPGLLIIGAAAPLVFLTVNLTALEAAPAHGAGLALGLLNTCQWVGGAIGVAVVGALAGAAPTGSLAGSIALGYWLCAALGAIGAAVALTPAVAVVNALGGHLPADTWRALGLGPLRPRVTGRQAGWAGAPSAAPRRAAAARRSPLEKPSVNRS